MSELKELIAALEALGVDAERVATTLNVTRGRGPTARRANIDPEEVLHWLRDRDSDQADVASWASGVATALMQPARSLADSWSFTDAAGSLLPTLEGPGFSLGVADVNGGDAPWLTDLATGTEVRIAWLMRLGRGVKIVTQSVTDRWEVKGDRISSAGRSMLFHGTRDQTFGATPRPPVERLHVGDGSDAARLIVVADAFFSDVDGQWRFATPTPDTLLAVRHDSEEALHALREHADALFDSADYPLTRSIWSVDGTRVNRE